MEKSKKFRMPSGIRNKLMAAIAMLLVSSIMMVSSTYAWFTLSTAPEVTGITTSVGANGNLEMALLNTATYKGEAEISSAVGTSSATAALTAANITWGNLVDLSDASYGLQNINLQPARLNFKTNTTGEGTAAQTTYISNVLNSVTSPLMTPTYGKDGRVAAVDRTTYSTILDAQGAWTFSTDSQQYGVRAIGSNDNLTPQQAGLMAAKAAYGNYLSNAKSTIQSSLSRNGNALAGAITALAMGTGAELTDAQKTAIGVMITDSNTALNHIDAAYKQVLLAYAANQVGDPVKYTAVVGSINSAASFNEALTALQAETTGFTLPQAIQDAVDDLADQKQAVATAQTEYNNGNYTTALDALVDADKVIINGFDAGAANGSENALRDAAGEIRQSELSSALINDGGAVVEMPDGSGVFAYVGSVAGNYSANCFVDINYQSINMSGIKATMRTTATVDPTMGTAVNGLQAAASTGSASTVLSDLYGYALDFAFRTNAADSYLQLQTEGAQRVYSDSTSLATMGAGSTMTFQATTNDAGTASLTNDQVKSLMQAIRVAFVDKNANIYGIAALEDITEGADGFTGKLYMQNYTVDTSNGSMEVTGKKVDGSNATNDPKNAANTIMKLDQSVAAQLTVIVFLDGDKVDNADVANATQSLVGTMNLQFASSAELIPMQNTALQNMTIIYNELTDADYKVGLYTFNGNLYKINTGYKIYQGTDNTVYFSNDDTNYTKLTVMNQNTVLSAVTASVTGTNAIEVNGTTTLTAGTTTAGATVKSAAWAVEPATGVVNVAANDPTTTATVTGVAAGTAKITATVTLEFTADGAEAVTKTAIVEYEVTVKAPAAAEPETPATYTVSLTGATGAANATEGEDYIFTVSNASYTEVTVTVGGNTVTPTAGENNTYTIAGADVTGNIVITAAAPAAGGEG